MKKSLLCILLVCVLLLGGCTPIYKQPKTVLNTAPISLLQLDTLKFFHFALQSFADWFLWMEQSAKVISSENVKKFAEWNIESLENVQGYVTDYIDIELLKMDLRDLGVSATESLAADEVMEYYQSVCARLIEAYTVAAEKGADTDFNAYDSFFAVYEEQMANAKKQCDAYYNICLKRLQQMNSDGLTKEMAETCKTQVNLSDSIEQVKRLMMDIQSCFMELYQTFTDTAMMQTDPADSYQKYQLQLDSYTEKLDFFVQSAESTVNTASSVSVDFSGYPQILEDIQQQLATVRQIHENFGAFIQTGEFQKLTDVVTKAMHLKSELSWTYMDLMDCYHNALTPLLSVEATEE